MGMAVPVFGEDIIHEIAYHKHKICHFQKILINNFKISPDTVENWIKIL